MGPWRRRESTRLSRCPILRARGHDVDAVHAASALSIVDLQFAAVPPHAPGGTQADHFLHHVELAPVLAGVGAGIGHELAAHIGLTAADRCGCRLSTFR